MFTVVRFDAIKGTIHAVMTMLTFFLLLSYHFLTRHSSRSGNYIYKGFSVKFLLGNISVLCIVIFGTMVTSISNPGDNKVLWTVAVTIEIIGVIFLGAMDMLDIYALGESIGIQDAICGET